MASSLVANARTGSLRARMRRPALVNKCTLNGAGSGSSVGLFGVRAFTLSQQKRRAESRRELIAGAVAEGARQQDAVILADACVGAARRIMTELLTQRAGMPRGRA